ncbi:hypothetical protein C7H19_12220 [Aphanothece hegewaldii CCALA 016]|uniref:Cell division protein FtsL n=1 Tax=Aphanothece hegewaldii CCALA 016 TaxID=2107694 RepID=A0A2T1LX11_9CHRO|nr:hypothetical protein [Aphanothece hegewaldii]PSF36731.1 hypothetical protein C7H19_12220 [Aphanothece hegewaldii CCALA 016]
MSVSPLIAKPQKKITKSPRFENNLKKLPVKKEQLSSKLQFLLFIQKGFSFITFCLVATTLGMYAWTVYFPKLWTSEYKKLETLQRYERHIVATNESLKNQLAQQAEKPETGLSNPSPTQSIFLTPTSEDNPRHPNKPKNQISSNSDAKPTTPITNAY